MKPHDHYPASLQSRNGPDGLFWLLAGVFLILLITGAVCRLPVLLIIDFAIGGAAIFRLLSRDIPARKREDRLFLALITARHLHAALRKRRQKKRGEFFTSCPACGAKLKIKRTKGDFAVTCPRCQTRFRLHIR